MALSWYGSAVRYSRRLFRPSTMQLTGSLGHARLTSTQQWEFKRYTYVHECIQGHM